jgi:hypothetical protein
MKDINYKSTNYSDSYDNEAFAPQDFDSLTFEEKPKITDFIKRVKNNVGRIQPESN